MSKKNNKIQRIAYPKDLAALSKQKRELELLELQLIEKALTSTDPQSFIEAKTYIQGIEERKANNLRSYTYSPLITYYTGQGFKYKPQGLNNDILRAMSQTPQISAIIKTRIEQASNFNGATIDTRKPGWTISKKKRLFEDKEEELTDQEKREIEYIIKFIEDGGNKNAWDFEGFETFTRKLFDDSWSLDQGVFEVAVDRRGKPTEFDVYDGATFYMADHGIRDEKDMEKLEPYMINGYLPRYVQVFDNVVYREYYPWELCLGVRNASTSIKLNGYGLSENEILIQIITWMLGSNQYNGNFFTQGSNPYGFLNFKENIDPLKLDEFKQAWSLSMSGVRNAHKLAAISGGDVEWVNMRMSNKDMEFQKWSDFLTILACTVYRIDPSEVGFHVEGGASVFGQDGQKERIRHSLEKGLEPFLKFWEKKFTKFIVGPLSEGRYQFKYTGVEPDDDDAQLDKDIKLLTNGGLSLADFFMKYNKRELDLNKDIIMNAIALQYKQLMQQGGQESNESVDQMSGEYNPEDYEQNPFAQFEESEQSDPFTKSFNIYMDKFVDELKNKK
jgi:hypothetical protein